MNKLMIRILCCFIPDRKYRHMLRKCRFGRYKIKGKNNYIYYYGYKLPKYLTIIGLNITIDGNHNKIIISGNRKPFKNCHFILSTSDNKYILGKINFLHNVIIHSTWGNGQCFYFGDNSDCNGMTVHLNETDACVKIGANTIMSTNIDIWPTDTHSLIDISTNRLINKYKSPIEIGDNCWIGQGVKFMKGSVIASHTVVGAGAIVTRQFTEHNIIIAGNPAHIIKTHVRWNPENPYYMDVQMNQNK